MDNSVGGWFMWLVYTEWAKENDTNTVFVVILKNVLDGFDNFSHVR